MFGSFIFCRASGMKLLGDFLEGILLEGWAEVWGQGAKGDGPAACEGPSGCSRAFRFPGSLLLVLEGRLVVGLGVSRGITQPTAHSLPCVGAWR